MDHGMHYRLRLQVAGLPIIRKREQDDAAGEITLHSQQMANGLFSLNGRMMAALFRGGQFKRVLKAFRLLDAQVYIRLSFADAAYTALAYAALRTVLQTVLACLPDPRAVKGHVDVSFDAKGSEAAVQCIFGTRLGILAVAMMRMAAAVIRLRRADRTEERYAEASH
ncbi:MAG: hypothetical protein PUD16_01230 [bacterium]|nr:hypothetical protein [bacterium]